MMSCEFAVRAVGRIGQLRFVCNGTGAVSGI